MATSYTSYNANVNSSAYRTEQHHTMTKEIKYDRATRDHAMYLNGEFVGYAPNYHAAEIELDRLAYEALRRAS